MRMSICNAKKNKYLNTDYKSLYSRHSDYKSEWTFDCEPCVFIVPFVLKSFLDDCMLID